MTLVRQQCDSVQSIDESRFEVCVVHIVESIVYADKYIYVLETQINLALEECRRTGLDFIFLQGGVVCQTGKKLVIGKQC